MASKSSDPLESAKQLCRDASELRAAARDAVDDSKEAIARSRRLAADIHERKGKKIAQPIR